MRMKSAQPEPIPASLTAVASPKSAKKTRRGATATASVNGDDSILEDDAEDYAAMAGPDMSQDVCRANRVD